MADRRQTVVVDGEVSSWKSVLSGVPHVSVLTPILLCLVYIIDLEEMITGKLLKFADYTKLFRKTKDIGDKHKLQDYLNIRSNISTEIYIVKSAVNIHHVCYYTLEDVRGGVMTY